MTALALSQACNALYYKSIVYLPAHAVCMSSHNSQAQCYNCNVQGFQGIQLEASLCAVHLCDGLLLCHKLSDWAGVCYQTAGI